MPVWYKDSLTHPRALSTTWEWGHVPQGNPSDAARFTLCSNLLQLTAFALSLQRVTGEGSKEKHNRSTCAPAQEFPQKENEEVDYYSSWGRSRESKEPRVRAQTCPLNSVTNELLCIEVRVLSVILYTFCFFGVISEIAVVGYYLVPEIGLGGMLCSVLTDSKRKMVSITRA